MKKRNLFYAIAVIIGIIAIVSDAYAAGAGSIIAGNLFLARGTETGGSVIFESIIEDYTGGGVLGTTRLRSSTSEIKPGSLVYISNGTAELIKTAKIVTGGTATEPRIEKGSQFKANDFITDGKRSLKISSIDTTTSDDYDVLTLTDKLVDYSEGQYLYESSLAGYVSGYAKATVEEAVGAKLTLYDPSGLLEGMKVALEQASDDNLAIAYDDGVLTISLADTTASNNTAALIEAAIQDLGIDDEKDFSDVEAVGSSWSSITGATITTASDEFEKTNEKSDFMKYVPNAVTKNSADVSEGNASVSAVVRGTVIENSLTYTYVHEDLKAQMPLIRFV